MSKKVMTILGTAVLILSLLVACGLNAATSLSTPETATSSVESVTAASSTDTLTTTATTTMTVATALAENAPIHGAAVDDQGASAAVTAITLQGDAITVDGEGASVDGSTVTITAAGAYNISGALTDGQLVVDTEDEEVVRLLLNGVTIHKETSAAMNVVKAQTVVVFLVDGTENVLSDGAAYTFADPATDEPNATLFSDVDLTIAGSGSLRVEGNYNDGIASKDGLIITGGTLDVVAVDDGIRGKDYLVVQAGAITVNAGGDGLKSDDAEDTAKGYIAIADGVFTITAGGDALAAESDALITGGEFTLTTAGGSTSTIDADLSAKAIKAGAALVIENGRFTINAADDGLHSNTDLAIHNGVFTIASGDDAIHADAHVLINGGEIDITQSYEGIESTVITINNGTIHLVSSDDGVNAADATAATGGGRGPRGPRGQEVLTYEGTVYLYINGGYLAVDAGGDGLDANGAIEMTGGTVIVNGPTMRMNSALDYDALFKITGGMVVGAGSAGMAQAPGVVSTQNSVLINFDTTQPAGTVVHLQSADGEEVLTFAPAKAYQSIAFSSTALVTGATYAVYVGGTATGAATDGLYAAGSYTPGTAYTTFTIADVVTRIGNSGR